MAFKKERILECFIAVRAFVRGGGNVARSVDSLHVHPQIGLVSEGFLAVGAGEWSLSRVNAHVILKSFNPDERGITILKLQKLSKFLTEFKM